jgi:hypothetical protein
VLDAMEVFTVVWEGDESKGALLDDLAAEALRSKWWDAASEYGVGRGTSRGVVVAGPAPARVGPSYDALVRSVVGKKTLDGGVVPPPSANTVFTFLVPKGTEAVGGGDYHVETDTTLTSDTGAALHIPYIVMLQQHVGFVSDVDYLTWSYSHELVETATDPRAAAWTSALTGSNSEIGDLCNDIPVTLAIGGTERMMTRFWSVERAAARSGDPCVPALPAPYANVALAEDVVHVPAGPRGTDVRLVPFSYGSAAPIHWALSMGSGYHASIRSGTDAPGDEVVVTITRDGNVGSDPRFLQVWVTDPAHPNANIPVAEWFGGLVPSP